MAIPTLKQFMLVVVSHGNPRVYKALFYAHSFVSLGYQTLPHIQFVALILLSNFLELMSYLTRNG